MKNKVRPSKGGVHATHGTNPEGHCPKKGIHREERKSPVITDELKSEIDLLNPDENTLDRG